MSIHQLNINGLDKVEVAIKRIQTFEPPEGYYLAFSGGKDSVVVKKLMDMAGVKYDAHYNITSVDPPELVQFVKTFPDVSRDRQYWKTDGLFHKIGDPVTMWNLIPEKKMPPTRLVRYCCSALKESSGENRFVVTGVRHAESVKRKSRGGGLELGDHHGKQKKREWIAPDNPSQELIHICMTKKQRILNPIIDWDDGEVWEFIREYNVPYCKLYDEGFKRLGCIGCPMGDAKNQKKEFERWPKFRTAYIKAFERMIKQRSETGSETDWETGEEVMRWWLKEKKGEQNEAD